MLAVVIIVSFLLVVMLCRSVDEAVVVVLVIATAVVLGGCADHYGTAQLPACTSHCTFTDGGRQVSVSK